MAFQADGGTRRGLARLAASSLAAIVGMGIVFLTVVPAHATFHGSDGRIAFTLDEGSGAQIYTINPDGTGQRQLTHVHGAAVDPDWSPNGRQIVFEHDYPDDFGCSIALMDADGTHVRNLTATGPYCNISPAFMPGGDRIVFIAGDGPITSMNLRGGDRRVIFRGRDLDKREPQVSPDGGKVLFLVEKDLGTVNGIDHNEKALYSVQMNGTHLKPVVPFHVDVCACGGDWSPNANRIVFSTNAGAGEPQRKPMNVATIDPDGTRLRFVTHNQGITVETYNGSYSPDGRWILVRTARHKAGTPVDPKRDKFALWKIHPDGTGQTLIATFKFSPSTRDWGPPPT